MECPVYRGKCGCWQICPTDVLHYPTDFALAKNDQVTHVSSPVYSEHIRALSFSLLPLEPDTLFYFLIDSVHSKACVKAL